MENNLKKKLIHFAVYLKLTTYCKSIILQFKKMNIKYLKKTQIV